MTTKCNEIPIRCVDPVMKFCQDCLYGYIKYPSDVETYSDTLGCCFESGCTLGYDKGRLEDEPTKEELQEFEEWCRKVHKF